MGKYDTKEKIIQAALKALLHKGFNGVGVQEITEKAGVPKGSFYNHFESKEALGVEIVERYGMGSTRRDVLTDKTVSPLERLRIAFCRAKRHVRRLQIQSRLSIGQFQC